MQLVRAYNTRRMISAVGTRCSTWQDLSLLLPGGPAGSGPLLLKLELKPQSWRRRRSLLSSCTECELAMIIGPWLAHGRTLTDMGMVVRVRWNVRRALGARSVRSRDARGDQVDTGRTLSGKRGLGARDGLLWCSAWGVCIGW
jgi:hypothetical protein